MKNKRVIWAVLSLCIVIGLSVVGVVSASDFGPWSIETVDSNGKIGEYTSLELNSMGNPRISYFDKKNNDLKYASWDGTVWKIETVDNSKKVGEYSSLALDSNDNPRISYFDKKNNDLKYASWDGAVWKIETVDSSGKVGEFSSLKLDINNDPRIAYYDRSNRDLKIVTWNGASWKIETVDSIKGVGTWISIALDSAGDIHISYYDLTKRDLKYAKGTGHALRNTIAGQLFGQDITQGEYLEKLYPEILVNLSPEAKQRIYQTKIEWPNTFDTVTYESNFATSVADPPIQKNIVFSQASDSIGSPVLLGNTELKNYDVNYLKSKSTTFTVTKGLGTPYTPEWVAVESYIQQTDKPYDLFVKWKNIGVATNFKLYADSVTVETNSLMPKGDYYQGYGVHHTLYKGDIATCYTDPSCDEIQTEFSFAGPFYFNPYSAPLTITPIQQQGGIINPLNPVTVPVGGSQLFTITPNSGYIIQDVRVNGISQGAISSYQFTNVKSDQTITAIFKQQSLPPIVPLCPAGTPFDANKYPQNWPQSDPMTFTCNWDGNGRVYLSGSSSALIGTYADDGFTVDTPKGIQFDAEGHYAHQHAPLELTSGLNPGSNTLTLIVRNYQRLSMSYGSSTGIGTDQVPYIIEVNDRSMIASAQSSPLKEMTFVANSTALPENPPVDEVSIEMNSTVSNG